MDSVAPPKLNLKYVCVTSKDNLLVGALISNYFNEPGTYFTVLTFPDVKIATREFATIGKETNRKWEREDDISLLNSAVIEYRRNETEKLVTDIELQRELETVFQSPRGKDCSR
jgi:hypothetical protein